MSNDNLPNVPWVLGEYWPAKPRYGRSPAMDCLPILRLPPTPDDLKTVMKLIDEEEQD